VDEATKLAISGINGGAFDRVYRVVLPNGSVRWISSHGRVFFEGEGEQPRPVRFVGVNMDVTDRRQSEDLLREGQKLESIGLLAGGVAHDFNNLLTVIIGNASTAPDGCTTRDQTEAILSAAERAAQLTRQLLAYAGKGYVIARVVDLTDLVARSRALLLTSVPRRVKLDFRLGERLPCIEADPSRIEQVLLNLVSNAGEAIPPGTDGLVEVSTGQLELTPELARQHSRTWEVAAGMYVWLEVRDNGAGMDESTLSRMFDPFFSTKFTGRGLGLAAVQGIVRSGKGFLDVKSMPEGGTSFRVYLPASAKQPAVKEVAPLEVKRGTATVLVVDDEDMVRKVACHMLRSHGYEVREAADGRQALGVLEGEAVLPAAVLLDLAMPVMGGEELIPILEQRYPEVKIVVSSGYPEEEARKGFPQRAVAGFLQKPYTASVLAAKMGEVLDEE
jgi:signal transduction histidine kinase/ActR/RegA family two-component response regulator